MIKVGDIVKTIFGWVGTVVRFEMFNGRNYACIDTGSRDSTLLVTCLPSLCYKLKTIKELTQ